MCRGVRSRRITVQVDLDDGHGEESPKEYKRTTRSDCTAAFHESVTSKHFLRLVWQQRSVTGRRTASVWCRAWFATLLRSCCRAYVNVTCLTLYEFWMRNELYIGETTCWNLRKLSSVLEEVRLIEFTTQVDRLKSRTTVGCHLQFICDKSVVIFWLCHIAHKLVSCHGWLYPVPDRAIAINYVTHI